MPPLSSTTLRIGDRAPNFVLPDLDGRPFELNDVLLGGAVLLSFAPGTWSPNTRQRILDLEAVHERLDALGVISLFVVTERARDARRTLHAFLATPDRNLTRPTLSFPVLVDEEREVARDYGVFRMFSLNGLRVTRPAVFIVDSIGQIAFAYVGARDDDAPDTGSLLHLVAALRGPRLLPVASLLDTGPRLIQEWDTSALPRISRKREPRGLDASSQPIPLPAASTPTPEPVLGAADDASPETAGKPASSSPAPEQHE